VAAAFDVSGIASKPEPEEFPQALLAALPVVRGIHRPKEIILTNATVKRGHHFRDAIFTDGGVKFGFVHGFILTNGKRVTSATLA
jgi:hypothetical protein